MKSWIKLRVGNGATCRFWTDNWSPLGSLRDFFAASSAPRQAVPLDITLSDLYRSGNWVVPNARSEAMLQVQMVLSTMSLGSISFGSKEEFQSIVFLSGCLFLTGPQLVIACSLGV